METQNTTNNAQQAVPNVNRPEKKFSAGPVRATIWRNESSKDGNSFEYHSISVDRGYKDKQGAWKSTSSLRLNDIPRAKLVLEEAYRYLVMKNERVDTQAAV